VSAAPTSLEMAARHAMPNHALDRKYIMGPAL
jgi:hypothetical protein